MGIHLIVLDKIFPVKTNMTGFKVIAKYFCDIVPWTKVDSASQGLSHLAAILVHDCVSFDKFGVFIPSVDAEMIQQIISGYPYHQRYATTTAAASTPTTNLFYEVNCQLKVCLKLWPTEARILSVYYYYYHY